MPFIKAKFLSCKSKDGTQECSLKDDVMACIRCDCKGVIYVDNLKEVLKHENNTRNNKN